MRFRLADADALCVHKGIKKSQLHRRCEEWLRSLATKTASIDDLAESFCQYGGFLNGEKARLAELGDQQLRHSKIIAVNYGKAMKGNRQSEMDKFRRQSEANERAFEVTKLEVEVLNYHLDLYKQQKIYRQLQDFGAAMAVQVGKAEDKEFVMRPDVDLPDADLQSALDEEEELKAYMKQMREEKLQKEKEERDRERERKRKEKEDAGL